MTNKA